MAETTTVFDRARSDPAFRKRLLANAAAALAEAGSPTPSGAAVEAIDVRSDEIHLNLDRDGGAPSFRQVIEQARNDKAFRQRLLADPKAVVQEFLSDPLPPSTSVRVHEPPPAGIIRLFVPPLESQTNGELSDSELESVAGGGFFKNVVGAIREWACKDMHAVEINDQNNTYQVMTDTSHKPPTNETGSIVVW